MRDNKVQYKEIREKISEIIKIILNYQELYFNGSQCELRTCDLSATDCNGNTALEHALDASCFDFAALIVQQMDKDPSHHAALDLAAKSKKSRSLIAIAGVFNKRALEKAQLEKAQLCKFASSLKASLMNNYKVLSQCWFSRAY